MKWLLLLPAAVGDGDMSGCPDFRPAWSAQMRMASVTQMRARAWLWKQAFFLVESTLNVPSDWMVEHSHDQMLKVVFSTHPLDPSLVEAMRTLQNSSSSLPMEQ